MKVVSYTNFKMVEIQSFPNLEQSLEKKVKNNQCSQNIEHLQTQPNLDRFMYKFNVDFS